MKTISLQLPTQLTKPIPLAGSSPPKAATLLQRLLVGSGQRVQRTFRSLRVLISGLLDRTAYDQVSLGREVSVAFTSQGPVVYRYGHHRSSDSVSATPETNRNA
jgi:hypothetical protein